MCYLGLPSLVWAETDATPQAADAITGPASVDKQLESDQSIKSSILGLDILDSWQKWKAGIAEKSGLDFGLDYNALGFVASESLGEKDAASGVFRFYGNWTLVNRGTNDAGGIVFKIENRHGFTDVAPKALAAQLGYAGLNSVVFSDQGWRTTHLFWSQNFRDGRGIAYAGFLDVTDYTDVYALGSPWAAFNNSVFGTGSGTIGDLPDGALGVMVGGFLTNTLYAGGGIVDANGDTSNLSGEAQDFFDDPETFKTLEFGWSRSSTELDRVNNIHATLWQVDERSEAGMPKGWGIAFSASSSVNEIWIPFFRGGWSEDGGSLYEASLSFGFGYQPKRSHDQIGVGLNISRPNPSTFGPGLNDQFTSEIFYRLQVSQNFVVTPSIQLLGNPALNPEDDFIAIFGLRGRVSY